MRWIAIITFTVLAIVFLGPIVLNWGHAMKDRIADAWREHDDTERG